MTACASPEVSTSLEQGGTPSSAAVNENEWAARAGCVITVDGSYAARLARSGDSWFPERWTLDGPEPYAVPLPGNQPEEPGTEVLPMADGRVLIHRLVDGRHTFSLLYPTGPGTGEVLLGAVECPDVGTELRLLPPAPAGTRAYALAVGRGSTAVWLVAGGAFGPEHLAEVPGRCSGGVWLGGGDRLLALDRQLDGRTKTVVVDLERGGEVSPLLQISEESNDRLLLADADSGLLLIRSDAPSPGQERLGWGVLGSTLPVRFPEYLQLPGRAVAPFAIQPGQVLTPESCAVALRIGGPSGSWLGMWRPAERYLHQLPAPNGWLAGAGQWTRDGVLHLPYATGAVPCGVSRVGAPTGAGDGGPGDPDRTAEARGDAPRGPSVTGPPEPATARPVPLQQAPLTGRLMANAFAGRRLAQAAGPGAGRSTGPSAGPVGAAGGTGWVAAQAPEPVPVRREGTGWTAVEDTGPVSAGWTGVEGTGESGAGWTAVEDTGQSGAGWTADGTGQLDAEGAGNSAAEHTSRATAESASPVPGAVTGRPGAERTNRASAEGTGRAPVEGVSDVAAGHPLYMVPADTESTLLLVPIDPESSGPMAAEGTGGAPAESIRPAVRRTVQTADQTADQASAQPEMQPAVRAAVQPVVQPVIPQGAPSGARPTPPSAPAPPPPPAPFPVNPLQVEQVSTECPPALRALRASAETTPPPAPLKVTTE
ncbi:hypothetical protein QF035_007269 [Streptomyces umbrinus]|uniref:Uncharacterized protein n=1 Tax=Streptomyces umbrinus TaxID=67370 RepID=A0ABU0T1J2_9ACTN|nr:hypothetical protein [Streptomyces umbrinus]